jgi:hypothetical protein
VSSGALDPGSHLARHQPDLPSLVAQRPKVDALASRRGVGGEKSRAVLSRADAKLASKLVWVSIQERREDVAKDSLALGAIFGDPGPHRGKSIGKTLRVAAAVFELTCQAATSFGESVRRRVIRGGKPAVSSTRNPAQSGVRAPAPDPKRDAAPLSRNWRELDIGRHAVVARPLWTRLSLEQCPQRCDGLVESLPALVERDAQGVVTTSTPGASRSSRLLIGGDAAMVRRVAELVRG